MPMATARPTTSPLSSRPSVPVASIRGGPRSVSRTQATCSLRACSRGRAVNSRRPCHERRLKPLFAGAFPLGGAHAARPPQRILVCGAASIRVDTMTPFRLNGQPMSLRKASAMIFALTAMIPLLVLLSLLWRFELVTKPEVQLGLFLALVVALLGFSIFRRMVDRISSLAVA